jgi:alcohol dehydrogenase, propanol-preferring
MCNIIFLDLHIVKDSIGQYCKDVSLGHEGVGVVVKLGPKVTRFQVGDYGGVAWLGTTCLECRSCLEGKENLCPKQLTTGYQRSGSHAEYFIAHEHFAAKIPKVENITHYAPVLCAGVTSFRAVNRLELPKGSRIIITGVNGGLGLMALQYAKALGLNVVGVGRMTPEKIDIARKLHIDELVDSNQAKTSQELIQAILHHSTETNPIMGALILSPSPVAIEEAVEYVSPGGVIVTVILSCEKLQLDLIKFTNKELTLRSSLVGTPKELQQAVDMMTSGKITTHIVEKPFHDINYALSQIASRSVNGRIVLTP